MATSWWKRTMALLCGILVSALCFFGWTSVNVTGKIRQTVEQENANSLRLWASDVESRTGAMYEHIYELLVALHNSNQLRTGSPVMDAMTKQKILEMMKEKLIVSSDANAFFVFDTENDFYLFSAETSMDGREVLALKEYLRENAWGMETAFRDSTWQLFQVGSQAYLEKGVRMGKYLVGAVSNLKYYRIDSKFSVLGEDPVFTLETEDATFFCPTDAAREPQAESQVTLSIPILNAQACLSVTPSLSETDRILVPLLLFLDSAVCLVLIFMLLRLLRRKVAKPSKKLIHANETLAQGNLDYRLDAEQAGSQEFKALYESFNDMASQITKLRIEAYDLKLQEDANRLTMLRAQIRPHSFLNAITTISNMTYISQPEEVRAYIASFAKFIRYMLNVTSPWTNLSEELAHIQNYLSMQETRFPGSIRFRLDCQEETLSHEIPFLLLYTLVENSIKHAMTLYEALEIRIQCTRLETGDFRGICLVEEDSGDGFTEEALRKLFSEDALFTKEHLGLSNVRYTLNLLYHRNDLLHISNRQEGGARVEIRIPDREDSHEAIDL